MPASTEPNFGIKHSWAVGESYKPDMDANLKKLGALLFCSVKNTTTTAQPGSPAEGDRYIVGASATGAWSGKDKQIAVFANGAWSFYVAAKGWMVRDEAVAIGTIGCFKTFDGTNWVNADLGNSSASQPLDPDLTALANNSTNGVWARTGSGTGAARTIAGTTDQITATNGDGVSGNPTLGFPTIIKPSRVQIQNGVFDNAKDAVTKEWAEATGIPFILNGYGRLRNNANFPTLTFDPVELNLGYGSFKCNCAAFGQYFISDYLAVDFAKQFQISCWAKAGNVDGSSYDSGNLWGIGVNMYDADLLELDGTFSSRNVGATDTTLAAQLNPGATSISLTNATGWANAAGGSWWLRHFSWWPYTNSFGYTYPDYTYSRNRSRNYYGSVGAWNDGGISGNTITLSSAWTGPTLAAGTKVRNNGADGGTFKYPCTGATLAGGLTNAWQSFSGTLQNVLGPEEASNNKYRDGTAFIRILFLFNYNGSTTNINRVNGVSVRYL